MSGILDIGRSGIRAAQAKLQVTSENIANADTEGYHRRIAVTEEIGGGKMSPIHAGTQSQGVTVSEIKRAFDGILAERVRTASGAVEVQEAALPPLNLLEARLTPQPGGVLEMMDNFFDGIASVAGDPVDVGLRTIMIDGANSFVEGVKSLAADMENMIAVTTEDGALQIDQANLILKELGEIQQKVAVTQDTGALNPLFDRRDKLLVDLAKINDINVEFDDNNLTTVTWGKNPGGLVLIEQDNVSQLQQVNADRVRIIPQDPTEEAQSRAVSGGSLYGLSTAVGVIRSALNDLNDWAQTIAAQMNAIHNEGVDLDGLPGGDLFALQGWKVQSSQINRGTGVAEVTVTDPTVMPEGPLDLVRDSLAGLWKVYDPNGAEIASGDTQITLPGMVISLAGKPFNGDRIDLTRREGNASDLAFLISKPERIASASASTVTPAGGNLGNAKIVVARSDEEITTVGQMSALTGSSALTATEFLSAGVVGVIPSGTETFTLASMDRQASLSFAVDGSDIGALKVTIDGTLHEFIPDTFQTQADFVAQINDGTILDANGERLSSLGGRVMISGSELMLEVAGASSSVTATMTNGAGTSSATILADPELAADIAVFTRDGLQIAGAPLDPAEAEAFITEANGFQPGATYRMADLNNPDGYRGITMTQSSATGNYVATLRETVGLQAWATYDTAAITPAVTLDVTALGGGLINVPEGSSAQQMADLMRTEVDGTVTARTDISLAFPDDGKVRFKLQGDNVSPFQIDADVYGGDVTELAQAINLASPSTGISASIDPSAGRLILTSDSGADINISVFTHSTGGSMVVDKVDEFGNSFGLGTTSLGASGLDTLRAVGTVSVAAQDDFSVSEGALSIGAEADPFNGGRATREIQDAGATQVFRFAYDAALDGPSDDGLTQTAGSAFYTLNIEDPTVGTLSATFDPAEFGAVDDVDAAYGMASALRAQSPSSRMTGEAVANIPANGTMMRVDLGDQTYAITMTDGEPVVTGPEKGMVTAYFDASNKLVVETTDGAFDGAMLAVSSSPGNAAAFGMGATNLITKQTTGGEINIDTLPLGPHAVNFTLGGTAYVLRANNAGNGAISASSVGFPGTVSYDAATQKITITPPAGSGEIDFPPQAGAGLLGFQTSDTSLLVTDDGSLEVRSADNRILDITGEMQASGRRLTLSGLPNEQFIVAMGSNGATKLTADVTPRILEEADRSVEVRILDADNGLVGLYDTETGDEIARRALDENGNAQIGHYSVTFSAGYITGDSFQINPAQPDYADARTVEKLADLQMRNLDSGLGGFTAIFNEMVTDVGGKVSGAENRKSTANSLLESALAAEAKVSAVDLDTEAANLISQQQAYQANAQIISVARALFDTLINAL
ncbi:hypothetical protein HJ526_02680 [Donghicola sp. C2-DW-16]|uniref:Flagellar hook-associated protein 1 n=1 Tax=Donghicola mangrovi TaxID=2729614 RepID=A0ABX2PAB4_9RHOB|nr:flagellin hook IN motif-containing protein [Donghicola mangrovi]NVO26313.1 hypothetical protein [Donghicola mangrovi]